MTHILLDWLLYLRLLLVTSVSAVVVEVIMLSNARSPATPLVVWTFPTGNSFTRLPNANEELGNQYFHLKVMLFVILVLSRFPFREKRTSRLFVSPIFLSIERKLHPLLYCMLMDLQSCLLLPVLSILRFRH